MSETPHQRPVLALFIRILAVVLLATLAALVKLCAQRGVHLLEIMFWRQFLTIPVVLGFLAANRSFHRLKTNRPSHHVRRAFLGMVGMALNFGAAILLPLAEAQTLQFTAPLFATVLSVVILKEKVGLWRISALIAGFAGILVITSPSNMHIPVTGLAVGLGSAFAIGLMSILLKDLGRSEEPITIVFYFSAFSLPFLAFAMPFVARGHDLETWMLLALLGFTGLVAQFLLTLALRLGSVVSVIVMDYTGLIWATIYGAWLFGQLPPPATWIGAPLIVAAGLTIAWREHTLAKSRSGLPQPVAGSSV